MNAVGLAGRIARNAIASLLIVCVFTLGEEIGWRGYMQRRIIECHGASKGLALSAGIWAVWHIPFAMSGMHDIPGVSRWALVAIMPAGHFGLGIFLGWLFTRTGSIWLVAIAHGSANNWGQLAFKFMEDGVDGAGNLELMLANNAALLGLGLLLLWRVQADRADSMLRGTAASRVGGSQSTEGTLGL